MHGVEVVVTDSVSVMFFCLHPGMICMMCCTRYVFVVALKVKKASSAQNRGGLPTTNVYLFECSRSRAAVGKPRLVMPGAAFDLVYVYVIPDE